MLSFQYDNLNRLIRKTVPERAGLDPVHSRDVFYDYDLRNLQLYARFDSATGEGVTNGYDGFGRLDSSSINMGGVTRTLSYGYDTGSRRTRITYPEGQAFSYGYDARGALTGIYEGPTATGSPVTAFTYNDRGLPAARAELFGSGVAYTYDPMGRLGTQTDTYAWGTTGNVASTFGYNPAGQITQQTSSNDAYASNTAYNVNRSYAVNGLNQYTAAGGATFTYDANGNLTGDGTNSYKYDVENRLYQVTGGVSGYIVYDPLGRIFEYSGNGGITHRFLYDGDALVAEYNVNAGVIMRRYVHGNGAGDDPLIWYGFNPGQIHWLHADHQGSIVASTDGNGALESINAYDAWGIPNPANVGRFQYTGQIYLPEIGIYSYKARMYSATLGRFFQTDPVGYEDQVNLYAYVGNDPVNRTDPDGMQMVPAGARNWVGELVVDILFGDIRTAVREPTALNIGIAVVTTVPLGRAAGVMFKAARGAQQVARRLGVSPVARAARGRGSNTGIRFGARSGRPESVRVMRGDPNSPNPSQRSPYVTVTDRNGHSYGANGQVIRPTEEFPRPSTNPAAHIPIERFNPNRFRFDR